MCFSLRCGIIEKPWKSSLLRSCEPLHGGFVCQRTSCYLLSGIYIIEGGGFSVAGTASVTGSGVMIFNAGSNYPSTGGTYGSITLGGNGTCNLSPATSGIYAGIVFFQPLDNTKAITVTANASGISGTIYAPSAQLSESGNGTLDASLIVDTLMISGNGIADGPSSDGPAGTGGGLVTTYGGTTTLTNTITAGQAAGGDISGAVSGSNNLIGTGGSGGLIDGIDGNIVGVANTNESAAAFDQTTPNTSSSSMIPIKIKVTDALGNNVGSSSLPVVSMSVVGPDGNPVPQTAPGNSQPGNLFTFEPTTGTYQFNLKTKGYKLGS